MAAFFFVISPSRPADWAFQGIDAILGAWARKPKKRKRPKRPTRSFSGIRLSSSGDQAAVWSEQVPNALAHLQQRSSNRVRPGDPGSPLSSKHRRLNGLHAETHRKACRETNAKHWRVSSGSHCKRDGSFQEAKKKMRPSLKRIDGHCLRLARSVGAALQLSEP